MHICADSVKGSYGVPGLDGCMFAGLVPGNFAGGLSIVVVEIGVPPVAMDVDIDTGFAVHITDVMETVAVLVKVLGVS